MRRESSYRIALLTAGAAVILGLPAAIWAISTAKPDSHTFTRERLATLYRDVQAYDNLGMSRACGEARDRYNADAKAVTAGELRDARLPSEIDPADPRTDCRA